MEKKPTKQEQEAATVAAMQAAAAVAQRAEAGVRAAVAELKAVPTATVFMELARTIRHRMWVNEVAVDFNILFCTLLYWAGWRTAFWFFVAATVLDIIARGIKVAQLEKELAALSAAQANKIEVKL